jgi:DNA-binding NarL/FixJ family response regulator
MSRSPTRPKPRGTARPTPARSPRIRIVVADGQAIDRQGLLSLLRTQPDFECVGEATNSGEAIERCASLRPAVLVLTLNLPSDSGDTALPVIHAALPGLRILAISERGVANCLILNPPTRSRLAAYSHVPRCETGTDCLQLAMAHGALGTVRRSADPEALFRTIRAVAAGETAYEPRTSLAFSRDGIGPGTSSNPGLSVREMDVAVLLAEGQSNKEISGLLKISEPTVKKHVGQILKKLSVQDRLQAGLFVARHPLLFSRNGNPTD